MLLLSAGHGGTDVGAIAINGVYEKDINLETATYMYERFKQLGVNVKLLRNEDITLDPNTRAKMVKNSGAEYCLDIHFNAGGGDGFEAIHSIYTEGDLAETIADEVKEIGQNVRRVFTRTLPHNNNLDYYYMHRETGYVKTVILEGFFGDNKEDFKDFDTWEERKELAEAYIKGYCKHKNVDYQSPNTDEVFYRVVTGSFKNKENAEQRIQALKEKGFKSFIDIYKP